LLSLKIDYLMGNHHFAGSRLSQLARRGERAVLAIMLAASASLRA